MLTVGFLLLLGLFLLLLELFVVPGVTVVGIAGLLFLSAGVWITFSTYGTMAGTIVLVLVALLAAVSLYLAFRSKFWKKFELQGVIASKAKAEDANELNPVQIGEVGIAISALRPVGMVRFGNKQKEVECLVGLLAAGTQVEVAQLSDRKIYVKPIN